MDLEADLMLLARHANRWTLLNRIPGVRDWSMLVPSTGPSQGAYHTIEAESLIALITVAADWFRENP